MPYKIRDLQQLLDHPEQTTAGRRHLTALLETERQRAKEHFDGAVGSTWARLTERAELFDDGVEQRGGRPPKTGVGSVIAELRQLKKDADLLSADELDSRLSSIDATLDTLTEDVAGMNRDIDVLSRIEEGPADFNGTWGPDAYYDAFLDRHPAVANRGERQGFDYEAVAAQ